MDISTPDNSADKTIVLRISGNRLVSILNTLDALLYQTGHHKLVGNDVVADCPSYTELRALTEAIRDELSAQRCAHNVMVPNDSPTHVWKCAACGHVYG